ncbi:hypothetical protein PPL_07667 [Heterostelium album PN500]|uniref:Uncharacterized protein n=1 Tax=Heterostelium pallidum (strain ATCC 26659 / Pp 5 / PN500) TaxID=670386 RepID=D3BGL5_HETP5|nr:hypothetical protein PPL_07667 [Heterostelium album PN500]EFA79249.1 hypothetical protein PPL_07667 [Heterostelium album PN500]|eukprot:XP_020431370.1 hypothetical protein PPL_07667 [Heterostelium album PN500]
MDEKNQQAQQAQQQQQQPQAQAQGQQMDALDMSTFVQTLLEQMVRYRRAITMTLVFFSVKINNQQQQQSRFESMSDSILKRIDEMGSRIDELDKSISDLMNHANIPPNSVPSQTSTTQSSASTSTDQKTENQ